MALAVKGLDYTMRQDPWARPSPVRGFVEPDRGDSLTPCPAMLAVTRLT